VQKLTLISFSAYVGVLSLFWGWGDYTSLFYFFARECKNDLSTSLLSRDVVPIVINMPIIIIIIIIMRDLNNISQVRSWLKQILFQFLSK